MLDHAFQRRREIERMLLSGKRLTVPKLMAMLLSSTLGAPDLSDIRQIK